MKPIELEIKIEFKSERIGLRDVNNPDVRFMVFGLRMEVDLSENDLGPMFFKRLSLVTDQVKVFCQRHGITNYTDWWFLREVKESHLCQDD